MGDPQSHLHHQFTQQLFKVGILGSSEDGDPATNAVGVFWFSWSRLSTAHIPSRPATGVPADFNDPENAEGKL
jgi:hypothetical protein